MPFATLLPLLIQALVQFGPTVAAEITALVKKPDPTMADWEALLARVKPYDYYVNPPFIPAAHG